MMRLFKGEVRFRSAGEIGEDDPEVVAIAEDNSMTDKISI
jgi:hypothetical protein